MQFIGILFMVVAIAPYLPLGAFTSSEYQTNSRYGESRYRPKFKIGFTLVCFVIGLIIVIIF